MTCASGVWGKAVPRPRGIFRSLRCLGRTRERVRHTRLPSTGCRRDPEGRWSAGGGTDFTCAFGVWVKAVPRPRGTFRSLRCLGRTRERVRHARFPSTGCGRDAEGCWSVRGTRTRPVLPGCGEKPPPGPAACFEACAASAGRRRGCSTPACPQRAAGETPRDAGASGGHGLDLCYQGVAKSRPLAPRHFSKCPLPPPGPERASRTQTMAELDTGCGEGSGTRRQGRLGQSVEMARLWHQLLVAVRACAWHRRRE